MNHILESFLELMEWLKMSGSVHMILCLKPKYFYVCPHLLLLPMPSQGKSSF